MFQRLLNVLYLGRPGAVGSGGNPVVDREHDVAKGAELLREFLPPGLVAAPPRTPMNGQDGWPVNSPTVRDRFVEVECPIVSDAWIIREVLGDPVRVRLASGRRKNDQEQ